MPETVKVKDLEKIEGSINEVLDDLEHVAQVCANLVEHLKTPGELWMCSVDVQHLESRLDDVIRPRVSGTRSFMQERGYLVEPPREQV